jgi:hypothetical protein
MKEKIHVKNLIGRDNRWLDLSEDKVKFNIDHLFKIPATLNSLVFFPYQIDIAQIDEFNKYCNEYDYRVVFIGGESFYGGKSPYTNGTMTILLLHKDDEKIIDFPLHGLMSTLQYDPDDKSEGWVSRIAKYELEQAEENDAQNN